MAVPSPGADVGGAGLPPDYKGADGPGQIKSKLNMGQYQLNEELLNDVQLVFRNCDLYNVEGNEIYE